VSGTSADATGRGPLGRRLLAELVGTGALVAAVIGSGIAAQRLSPDDVGLQLLENMAATTLGLTVLIWVLGPVSGAHLNPAVTLVDWLLARRSGDGLTLREAGAYVLAQCTGALGGAVLAGAMFGSPVTASGTVRSGTGLLLGAVVATAGLIVVIVVLTRTGRSSVIAPAVGAWIASAYWFTSSTSFANPAVTLGRTLTDTFAGIPPASAPAFVAAQLLGGAAGLALAASLAPQAGRAPSGEPPADDARDDRAGAPLSPGRAAADA